VFRKQELAKIDQTTTFLRVMIFLKVIIFLLLSNLVSAEIMAIITKDLKLYDVTQKDKLIYLKKGSAILIENKISSKRGITWYKIKDGYVNSKYVRFVDIEPKPIVNITVSTPDNNSSNITANIAQNSTIATNITTSNLTNITDISNVTSNVTNTQNITLPTPQIQNTTDSTNTNASLPINTTDSTSANLDNITQPPIQTNVTKPVSSNTTSTTNTTKATTTTNTTATTKVASPNTTAPQEPKKPTQPQPPAKPSKTIAPGVIQFSTSSKAK